MDSRGPRLASPSGGLPSAVRWAQLILADRIQPGDIVIDATAGNGHDTLFLAQHVLPGGHVHAFDRQAAAIESTRARLIAAGIAETDFTLHHASHDTMGSVVPCGSVRAIMFNLGYLPGSDKSIITETPSTLSASKQALEILAPGGLMSINVYPGHEGGADEGRAIAEWVATLEPRAWEVQHLRPINRQASPPECWLFWKRT
ncbi:MAG: methyltransferase domain-containing protein [Verrucomicrobiales bacterium]|nr:methyltransferase domain-containing protein [Verrucomicrobiales bacterium]MCP5560908.1 methyltransferase domain-containing protein [Verrucomicrobiaceae bacterium]